MFHRDEILRWLASGKHMPVGIKSNRASENGKTGQEPGENETPDQRADKTADESFPALFRLKKGLKNDPKRSGNRKLGERLVDEALAEEEAANVGPSVVGANEQHGKTEPDHSVEDVLHAEMALKDRYSSLSPEE